MKTLEKKQSHISSIRIADQTMIQEVCQLIDWSEEQYCNYHFDQYTDFLKQMFFGYPIELYHNALYSSVMRGFWNNDAADRNRFEFLPFANNACDPLLLLMDNLQGVEYFDALEYGDLSLVDEFMFTHSAKRLMNDDVFMDGYARALQLIR